MIIVRAVVTMGSMPRFRRFIPAPAIKASIIPISDSPAINPEETKIPFWSDISDSSSVLFLCASGIILKL